jgi:hypothetical protein
MINITIKDTFNNIIFTGEVEDIKSINTTQYRIWFKSPLGVLLNESVSKNMVIIW